MHEAFIIVAVILFVIEAILWWTPNASYGGRLTPLGLAFFAASFLSLVAR
jgi:hypothetical protein